MTHSLHLLIDKDEKKENFMQRKSEKTSFNSYNISQFMESYTVRMKDELGMNLK